MPLVRIDPLTDRPAGYRRADVFIGRVEVRPGRLKTTRWFKGKQ